MEIIRILVVAVAFIIAMRCFSLAYRLFCGDPNEYEQNRRRVGSLKANLFGRVPTSFDGARDYRVAAGLAINRRTNEWVEQGRLSSEALASVLRQPS
jgi:hypothetical protein